MKRYYWKAEKNEVLKAERGIGFEDIVYYLEKGNLLDIIENPNQEKYKGQKIYIIEINKYIYMVHFDEDDNGYFLQTIYPTIKLKKKYLGDKNDLIIKRRKRIIKFR
jgi:hypothetical protein